MEPKMFTKRMMRVQDIINELFDAVQEDLHDKGDIHRQVWGNLYRAHRIVEFIREDTLCRCFDGWATREEMK